MIGYTNYRMPERARMVNWELAYIKKASKDVKKINSSGLRDKAVVLLDITEKVPYQTPPRFEHLSQNL